MIATTGLDHPLDDAYRKINRAIQQYDKLLDELREWSEEQSGAVLIGHNGYTDEDIVHIEPVPTVPQDWGDSVGEIVHNVRSALDYLIYELAGASGGDPEKDKTQFPFPKSRDDYVKPRGKRPSYRDTCLAGVREDWRKQVDELLPFVPQMTGLPGLTAIPLLSNRDKHMTAVRVRLRIVTPTLSLVMEGGDVISRVSGRLRVDREFHLDQYLEYTVRFGGRSRELFAFAHRWPDERVGPTVTFGAYPTVTVQDLGAMIHDAERVLDTFKPLLTIESERTAGTSGV